MNKNKCKKEIMVDHNLSFIANTRKEFDEMKNAFKFLAKAYKEKKLTVAYLLSINDIENGLSRISTKLKSYNII